MDLIEILSRHQYVTIESYPTFRWKDSFEPEFQEIIITIGKYNRHDPRKYTEYRGKGVTLEEAYAAVMEKLNDTANV